MTNQARIWTFARLLIAVFFALFATANVRGYIGQNPYIVDMQGPSGPVRCDSQAQVTVTVRDSVTGVLVPGQSVHWDFKKTLAPGDKVAPTTTVTDQNAQTSATVSFGAAEGSRTVRVMIASWPTTTKVACQGGVVNPTPRPTSPPTPRPTSPPTPPSTPTSTSMIAPPAKPTPRSSDQQPSSSPIASTTDTPTPATQTPASPDAPTPSVAGATPPATATSQSPDVQPSPSAGQSPALTQAGPSPTLPPSNAMSTSTIGLIGLVGVGVGAATYFVLRKR